MLPSRNHPAHAAGRFLGVAVVARYQMAVHMKHGLPRRFTAIRANVVAVRLVFVVQPGFGFCQQRINGPALGFGEVKPVGGVAFGDEQQVPFADGVAVWLREGQVVFQQRVGEVAEGALRI